MSDILSRIEDKYGGSNYGSYVAIVCPFHDDHNPSMMVYEDYAHCLSCGKRVKTTQLLENSGSSIPLISPKIEHKPIKNPWSRWLRKYADIESICIRAYKNIQKFDYTQKTLLSRGFTQEHIKRFKFGWIDNFYTVPIFNQENKLIGAVARSNDPDAVTRYFSPFGQDSVLYVPNWKLFNSAKFVILTYGIFDAVSCVVLGYAACTSTTGKRVSPQLLEKVRKPIYIFPDHKEEPQALQLSAKLGWRGKTISYKYPDTAKDPNDLLRQELLKPILDAIN